MTVKFVVSIFIIFLLLFSMVTLQNKYINTVENLIVYSEKIATGDNIEDSTFMFECLLSENARFISFFTHDSDLNELRDCLTAIRGSYSVGDIENAFVEVLRLKEKLFQMKSAMVPSVENIM